MKYGLARLVLGSPKFVEMTEEEYLRCYQSREKLLEALYLEEKFDVVVDNYLEFETDLLDSAARHMVRHYKNYSAFQMERNRINRRIINLLSACRLYIDHSAHHMSNIFGKNADETKTIKEEISRQYDASLGYRTMDALRNYVQHRGYPIHGAAYNSKWVENFDKLLFSLTPYIVLSDLQEDKKFKASVLEEMKSLGDKIDVKILMRQYIERLGAIHGKARSILKSHVKEWENVVENAIRTYSDCEPKEDSDVGLAAVIKNDKGTFVKSVPLFKDFIEYRRELEKRNSSLANLPKRYVTSEVVSN